MQEAKKLKHKADALVGFLPLITLLPLRYNALKEHKQGTLQMNQTFSSAVKPSLKCIAALP
jgi:hypothetical protein